MNLSPNQFGQTPIKGQVTLAYNHNTVSCVIDPDYAGDPVVPGQALKLVDVADGRIVVEPIETDEDAIFGFANFSAKDSDFEANDMLEVSCGDNVMYMEAGAAIARGAEVMPVVASTKVITAAGNDKAIAGFALDKAAADEDLIRIVVFGRQSSFTPAA